LSRLKNNHQGDIDMRNLTATIALAIIAATATSAHAQPAPSPVAVKAGQLLYTTAGRALAPIYRVTPAGDFQLIIEGQLVTVPAATVSMSGSKAATTLSLAQLRRMARR
jgi:hypothetical protein